MQQSISLLVNWSPFWKS